MPTASLIDLYDRLANAPDERTRASLLQWGFLFWLTQFAAIVTLLWRLWPQGQV